jgi:hypothetical protein
MALHAQLRIDTGMPVYFCDPQSPWQRGTNENTNGLLRQYYFPKGTDLTRHSAADLAAVAATLKQPAPENARLENARRGAERVPDNDGVNWLHPARWAAEDPALDQRRILSGHEVHSRVRLSKQPA